ncbi:DNA repair protein rad18 [Xylaria cf. heliscus]|nr:DNA repair protein rad18 [Xylaria cf. heliscus]
MNSDNLDNVADSTDWLSTALSGLSAVEAALRCQICKDFYRTPMLTSCNHTFCSLCIRRALSADGKCPLCRAGEQEMKLRSNWSMEEVVAAFTQTRSTVLNFARRPPTSPARPETSKRKPGDVDMDHVFEQPLSSSQQRSNKRLRSSARVSKTRGIEATAEMARQEANIPDPEPAPVEPDDGLVACPICWRRMKAVLVDRHIDTSCPGEPQPDPTPPRRSPSKPTTIRSVFAPSSSSSASTFTFASGKPQPPPDRLPALNYSMLKEAQLRRELVEQGLSTSGNRGKLERRHREWVMIWNANCDSQRPRRRAELLHDMDVWERTLGSGAPTGSRAANTGAQIRDKDFDGAAWAAKHDTSFKDLIANARRTRAQAQTKPDDGGGGGDEVNGTTAAASDQDSKTVKPRVEEASPMPGLLDTDQIVELIDDPPTIKRLEGEGKDNEVIPI